MQEVPQGRQLKVNRRSMPGEGPGSGDPSGSGKPTRTEAPGVLRLGWTLAERAYAIETEDAVILIDTPGWMNKRCDCASVLLEVGLATRGRASRCLLTQRPYDMCSGQSVRASSGAYVCAGADERRGC